MGTSSAGWASRTPLSSLTQLDSTWAKKTKVAKTGGIAAIIGALADHRDHAQMQYWGQIVLAHLCFLDKEEGPTVQLHGFGSSWSSKDSRVGAEMGRESTIGKSQCKPTYPFQASFSSISTENFGFSLFTAKGWILFDASLDAFYFFPLEIFYVCFSLYVAIQSHHNCLPDSSWEDEGLVSLSYSPCTPFYIFLPFHEVRLWQSRAANGSAAKMSLAKDWDAWNIWNSRPKQTPCKCNLLQPGPIWTDTRIQWHVYLFFHGTVSKWQWDCIRFFGPGLHHFPCLWFMIPSFDLVFALSHSDAFSCLISVCIFWDSLGQTLNHVMVCLRDCPAQGMFHRLSEGRLGWKHVGGASTEDWFRSLENRKTYSSECALFRVTSCCITIIWHDAMK